jgi:hypothetical protein
MSSSKRMISSRANGAHSRGPITPAGQSRFSRNAVRDGLLAKCLALESESREGFDSLLSAFVARFGPADGVELGMVEEMLSALWRQRRARAIKARSMDNAISTQPPDPDELARLADAFATVAAKPNLELMHRYETHLHRIFQRALANLILMRSLQELNPPAGAGVAEPAPLAENSRLPKEPNPISGHLV